MRIIFIAFLLSQVTRTYSLFPGAQPDEGDYRHLYSTVCISIRVFETPHIFPYSMGWLENLKYPKDRIHLQFLAESETQLYSQINKWSNAMRNLYLSVIIADTIKNEWYEESLVFGRRKSCGYVLLLTTDILLAPDALLNLIELDQIVVSPLIIQPSTYHSNGKYLAETHHLNGEKVELLRTYYVRPPILVKLKEMDSSYLSFDSNNQRLYTGPDDPFSAFGYSAYSMNIPVYLDNHHFYGYLLDSKTNTKIEHKSLLCSLLYQLHDSDSLSIHHSTTLDPWFPEPSSFGFDNIYIINLKRRPKRLERMRENTKILGIQYEVFEAVDGQALTNEDLAGVRIMPGYLDPYYKRPIKRGEIGCFLSHYRIWEEMVEKEMSRVLIFEDDIRFTENATKILHDMVEDLMKAQTDWDMIYLGRKKNDANAKEFFVGTHRYLSTITYSYWTLGYALSRQGAQKLLNAQPLDNLIALDEFLPIMYNQHPNKEWSSRYRERNLLAFTVYPLVVQPMRYTHEPGYISDTEDSIIANSTTENSQMKQSTNSVKLNIESGKHDEF